MRILLATALPYFPQGLDGSQLSTHLLANMFRRNQQKWRSPADCGEAECFPFDARFIYSFEAARSAIEIGADMLSFKLRPFPPRPIDLP
jgi:hypothetical protein